MTNIKLWKTQPHKIGQSGGLLGRPLGLLLKTGLPLIGNVLKQLGKAVLIQLGLTAAASPIDGAIHKKMFESWFTTLIISNEEMKIGASLLGNHLTGEGTIRADKGTIRAGGNF